MSYSLLKDAEHVVGILRIERFIEPMRDFLRSLLIQGYHQAKDKENVRQEFLDGDWGAVEYAGSFIRVSISSGAMTEADYSAAVDELAGTCDGDRDRASRLVALNVLLFILNRSVAECWNDKDDWMAMEQATRAALFDPAAIEEDVVHICRDVLTLDPYINAERKSFRKKLLEAYGVLNGTGEPQSQPDREGVLRSTLCIVKTAFLNNLEKCGNYQTAVDDIRGRTDTRRDPVTIIVFFVAFHLLGRFMHEDVGHVEAWLALDALMREEFLKYA